MQLQQPPVPDAEPAAAPADFLADAWSTTATTAVPDPAPAPAADRDFVADAWGLKPSAADPGDATPAATSPPAPAPVDDDQAVGLREAHERHLPYTLEALRYARANDRTFPKPVDKRGAELLYCVGASRSGPATGSAPPPEPPTSTDPARPARGREPGPVRSGRHDPPSPGEHPVHQAQHRKGTPPR
ncbi:hypothetical protein [Streptomyces acidicola]|uniref:hypothetical protein n=1 Tax=Streptomyces acidicola TaxID=2596892 RepID=UPI003815B841